MSGALRTAAWFGLGLVVFYLVFLGGGWVGIYAAPLRALSVVLAAIALAAWALAAIRNPDWMPRSALMPAFGVCLAAFGVGVVFARMPRLGIEYLAWSLVLVTLYLLFVRLLAHDWFRPRMMSLITVVTVLHGLAYAVQSILEWIAWWRIVGSLATPPLRPGFVSLLLGNPSAVMTVQVLLTLGCVAWIGWSSRGRAITSGGLLALAGFAVIVSGSRSGWIALAGTLILTAGLWLIQPGRRAWMRDRVRSRGARAGAAVALVFGLGLALVLGPGVMFRAAGGGENTRLAFFNVAIRMFEDRPLTGVGPGTWPVLRPAYTQPSEPNQYIPHAHNLPLHTLAEFGLLGAVAAVIAIAILLRLIRPYLADGDPRRRRMGWAALVGALYFAGHQLLDFYANMPTALFAFVIPMAYLDAATRRSTGPPRRGQLLAAAGGVLVALALAGLFVAEDHAASHDRAVTLADEASWEQALEPARAAVARDPDFPAYQFTLATIARHNGAHDIAYEAYRRAAEADDFQAAWLGLAAEQQERGLDEQARQSLDRALRLGAHGSILVGAADVRLRLGDEPEGTRLLARVVAGSPSLASDPRWTSDPELASVREPVLRAAREQVSGTSAVMLELALGDTDAASRLLPGIGEPTRSWLELVVQGWDGDRTVLDAMVERARARPVDLEGPGWAAILADRLGDPARATEMRRWADTVNSLYSLTSYRVGFAGDDAAPEDLETPGTVIYGHYTYRRPVPIDQIPAGLLQLERR